MVCMSVWMSGLGVLDKSVAESVAGVVCWLVSGLGW